MIDFCFAIDLSLIIRVCNKRLWTW